MGIFSPQLQPKPLLLLNDLIVYYDTHYECIDFSPLLEIEWTVVCLMLEIHPCDIYIYISRRCFLHVSYMQINGHFFKMQTWMCVKSLRNVFCFGASVAICLSVPMMSQKCSSSFLNVRVGSSVHMFKTSFSHYFYCL